ncbi:MULTISPECIES: PAS domain S-box protein [Niallia]|uniref:PAS domain-containing protein n=1 Tax=Niallia circulans TaxID=1397 RepID=A0A0J1IQ83_NIACI|nr:PAS domain S-box protein [Niallia circulans]KLV28121.1 hypothetical protein ABW02_04380 [Niallia circulans]MCM2980340.1 PAS domain S-box protein [Niallia circulans]
MESIGTLPYGRKIKSEQQLLDIIEASPDFIATADSNGNTTYLNPSARSFLGISESAEDLQSVNAQLWTNKFVELSKNGISNEKSIWQGENVLYNANGKKVPVSQTIVSHKATHQNVHFLSTSQEIYHKERHMKQLLSAKLYTIH